MARHLNFNPGREPIEYLEEITCGENRRYIIDQIMISLHGEVGRPNHQHHLLIGPRGSGKTHLLRLIASSRIPNDSELARAYIPLVMPEETKLRTPGDLYLRFVERLAHHLKQQPAEISAQISRQARGICLDALTNAGSLKKADERFELMASALDESAELLGRIILPISENLDQTCYLGAQGTRKAPLDEMWALRRHLQTTKHIFLIAAAPSLFGAVGDPSKPFYDFFRTHELNEFTNDESLEILKRRLENEANNPSGDGLRNNRVQHLLEHFEEKTPELRGVLVIAGGIPRYSHLLYEVIVETDVSRVMDALNGFLDELTPYFQQRLDPRVLPQVEIDLLHTLASAPGPQRPSELANRMYGMETNEVSELLGRLNERGFVKRDSRAGRRAVTWDVSEPLYRVWTIFRDDPDGQNIYMLLGKFVALLFSKKAVSGSLIVSKDSHPQADELFEHLYYALTRGDNNQWIETLEKLRILCATHPDAQSREYLAKSIVNVCSEMGKEGEIEQVRKLLGELRQLSNSHGNEMTLREALAKALANAINASGNVDDKENIHELLYELRELSKTYTEEAALRMELARGLFCAISYFRNTGGMNEIRMLLDELRKLSISHAEESFLREALANGLYNAINSARDADERALVSEFLNELRRLSSSYPMETGLREALAKGIVNASKPTNQTIELNQDEKLLIELRQLSETHVNEAVLREALAKGLVNATILTVNSGDLIAAKDFLLELFELETDSTENEIYKARLTAVLNYGFTLKDEIENGDITIAVNGIRWLEAHLPGQIAEQIKPLLLALKVLQLEQKKGKQYGEEVALAREPEEMRRVVRMILDRSKQ